MYNLTLLLIEGLAPYLEGKFLKNINKNIGFFNEYFLGEPETIKKMMFDKGLDVAIKLNKAYGAAILLIMEILCSFIFANDCWIISWSLVSIYENINDLDKYAWVVMVLKYMEYGLNKKSEHEIIFGCLPLIML